MCGASDAYCLTWRRHSRIRPFVTLHPSLDLFACTPPLIRDGEAKLGNQRGIRSMALLEVQGLVKRFGRRTVVDGVNFEVNPGEVVGLLGPNGAGKTTSFRMATGQLTPNAGIVYFNGQDVTGLPMYQRARLGMGYLSQETSVFRKLTTEQNIL